MSKGIRFIAQDFWSLGNLDHEQSFFFLGPLSMKRKIAQVVKWLRDSSQNNFNHATKLQLTKISLVNGDQNVITVRRVCLRQKLRGAPQVQQLSERAKYCWRNCARSASKEFTLRVVEISYVHVTRTRWVLKKFYRKFHSLYQDSPLCAKLVQP